MGKQIGYIVLHRFICPACQGVGVVQNPLWKNFHDAWVSETKHMSVEEIIAWEGKWWNERGYNLFANRPPAEETECIQCEGSGYIETEVGLAEALEELGLLEWGIADEIAAQADARRYHNE